ncbi:PTS sugar transporter subunit IIA [Haloimpatiens sp. FM7315]|uniref:PTS sugar transporter subunit IIA n=1 Tax=Haloimpatiens sp. FM7315 TaxID=3298609 RepID=UPI0035A2C728
MDICIDEDLIFVDMEFKSDKEALEFLCGKLKKKGYVKDTYKKAVLDREKEYPTGINFIDYGVAIPHASAEHVNKSTLAVATLKTPTEFTNIENIEEKVEINFICMIALADKSKQATFLSELMGTLSDKEKILEMVKNGNKNLVKDVLNNLTK